MNTQIENKNNQGLDDQEKKSAVNRTRRKLAKVGIVSPVIMTLSSRPVWAVNCTQSGMLSGNVSVNYDETCPLPGLSREYYINEIDNGRAICATPSGDDLSTYKFNTIFNPDNSKPIIFKDNPDMATVLKSLAIVDLDVNSICTGGSNDRAAYNNALISAAAESVAAWFNVMVLPWFPPSTLLTEQKIREDLYATAGIPAPQNKPTCSSLTTALGTLTNSYVVKNNPFI